MTFVNYLDKNEWWKLDRENMRVYNFFGSCDCITESNLKRLRKLEYDSWHELYLAKHYCPLTATFWRQDVWISPEGKFYDGDTYEIKAKYICEIIYGLSNVDCATDYLEKLGWIKATTSDVWELEYTIVWKGKQLTQKQFRALWNWCRAHRKKFPKDIKIIQTEQSI